MTDQEALDLILNAPIRFWTCQVCVSPRVKWVDGGLWAVCVECGRTSKDTPKLPSGEVVLKAMQERSRQFNEGESFE